jgi:UrcA family protein
MNSFRFLKVLTLIASSALAVTPLSAHSASDKSAGVQVSFGDLDLTTDRGIQTLYARIHRAADRYCSDRLHVTGSRLVHGYGECVSDAIDNTVRAVNKPALSALHADRNKSMRNG